MSYLGTMFLILTPFGFFCTENGTGLFTGTAFLILGILFKWLAKNGGGFSSGTTAKHYVLPEEFWKIHFSEQYNKLRKSGYHSENLAWIDVKDARQWADVVARAHGVTPPSDVRFEQIARELDIKTEKAIKAEAARKKAIEEENMRKEMESLMETFGEDYCRQRYGYHK